MRTTTHRRVQCYGWLLLLGLTGCGAESNHQVANVGGGLANGGQSSRPQSSSASGGQTSTSTGGIAGTLNSTASGGASNPQSSSGGGTAISTGGASTGGVGATAATGGHSSSGGSGTGGTPATGGRAAGGTPSTSTGSSAGGSGTGGQAGSGGTVSSLGGASAIGGTHATGGTAGSTGTSVNGVGACLAPCGASLQQNSEYSDFGQDSGATLTYDSNAGLLTLRNNPEQAGASEIPVLIFTFSSSYGYAVATTGPMWFVFTENYEYSTDFGGYSLKLDNVVTAEVVDVATQQTFIVRFSFQTSSVTIIEARVASCDSSQASTCQNATDCPHVEAGRLTSLSSGCQQCYTAFDTCSATHCGEECPGLGGNACMNCQTSNDCHTAFMQCSGLDYMPPATLTLPAQ